MPENDPYRVYVAHTFEEHEDYRRVFEYLESRDNFIYLNYSNPDGLPGSGGLDSIKEELRNQIEPAEVMIMPIAIFDRNPDLVRYQMDVAQAHKKPIIAVESFGETVAINKDVIDRCDDVIDWNDRAIINAIKLQARDERTAQWEVIDFDVD
jgi:hypothetical protein